MTPSSTARFARLLQPGLLLMRRFTMGTRILACCALALLPLGGMTGWAVWLQFEDIAEAHQELAGIEQIAALVPVVQLAQQHRLHARLAALEQPGAADRLGEARQRLAQALGRADELITGGTDTLLQERWRASLDAWKRFSAMDAQHLPPALWEDQSTQIDRLGELIQLVAERSRLVLNPRGSAYFLVDLAVQHIVPWAESLARLGEIGAAGIAQGSWIDSDQHLLYAHALHTRLRLQTIESRLGALQRMGEPVPAGWEGARHSALQLARQTEDAAASVYDPARATAHTALAEQTLHAAARVNTSVLRRLEQLSRERIDQVSRVIALQVAICTGVGLVMGYLGLCLYISFGSALGRLDQAVQAVAAGDLTHPCAVDGDTELQAIGHELGHMSQRLSGTVAEIRSTAARLAMSGERLSNDTTALAQRTESQATALAQTAGAVRQISDTVEHTARSARAVSQRAEQACAIADEGRQSMREAVAAMQEIEASARRTGEIVGLIEDIAFQTNMLSLNASVEAAKAGEAGRGFAVVAEEVRKLAKRSSDAAQEVGDLLETSARQVGEGVVRISAVDLTLGDIAQGIRDVAGTLHHIAEAATGQSTSLGELTATVVSLDDITRENAAMVRASHLATQALMDQAGILTHAVQSMRLWQGSSDEARTLVDRAVEHIRQHGLAAALDALHDRNGGFIDRDLYIFGFSRSGSYRVSGSDPSLVGQPAPPIATADGDLLTAAVWRMDPQGGWVDYQISHPQTLEIVDKSSYVRQVDDDLVIGCGVYKRQGVIAGQMHHVGAAQPSPAPASASAATPARA
jgi:methyl-accepting chemotaxis protein